MSSKKRKSGIGVRAIVLLLVGLAAAVCAFHITNLFLRGPKGTASITRRPVVTLTEQGQVKLYLPKKSNSGLYLAAQDRLVEIKGDRLDAALVALVAAGQGKGEAAGLIPDGTKVLSPAKVKGGTATVNLSKEFQENFSGGSEQEALTLNAIAHTLVNNSEGKVKKARILVEGVPAESLGGHFDLSEPIEADSTLLKPVEAD